MRVTTHFFIRFVTACLFAAHASVVSAQPVSAKEYSLKAAFLYNFARYTDWPVSTSTESEASLKLCILGDNHFGDALATIAGKPVKGGGLVIKTDISISDIPDCQVLFISASQASDFIDILQQLKGLNVLTVSDIPQFAERGGMISLFSEGELLRFAVNLGAVGSADLTISSRLLSLGKIIEGDQRW